jgi:hypothetical protein
VEEIATGEDDEIGVVVVIVVIDPVIVEPSVVMVVRPEVKAGSVVADTAAGVSPSAEVTCLIWTALAT